MKSYEEYLDRKKEYVEKNITRFNKRFNVKNKNINEFHNILKFNLKKRNSYFNKEDFFNLFFEETNSFIKGRDNILSNIYYDDKFQIIHSFAKNGKTTFYNYLTYSKDVIENHGLNIKFIYFDFSVSSNKIKSSQSTFLNKCYRFLHHYLFKGTSINDARLKNLIKLDDFFNNLRHEDFAPDSYDEESLNDFLSSFSNYRTKFALAAKNYSDSNTIELAHSEFEKDIINITNDIKETESGEFFMYLIMLHLLDLRNQFTEKINLQTLQRLKNKVVVYLDNIDDITSHLAKDVATNHAFYVSKFLGIYEIFFDEFSNLIDNFNFHQDITFIYAYRTANYVNSFQVFRKKYYLNDSQKNRYDEYFYNAKKHKLTTIKSSAKIIQKRFWFYKLLCELNDVKIQERYTFFNNINKFSKIKTSNYNDDINLQEVYRLWNGNREVIFTSDFFRAIDRIKIKKLENEFQFLEKGTYLHLFLTPLFYASFDGNDNGLSKIINYIFSGFRNCQINRKCELSRLLINIIINTLKKDDNHLRRVENSFDLNNKGISLLEILNNLTIINKSNEYAYQIDEIKELLNILFFEEIDAWGHLLTCTKTTTYVSDDVIYQGKFLNFDEEIEEYKKLLDDKTRNKASIRRKLSDIKFFYNDSAYYFNIHVLPNFEYFSLFKDFNKPLMFLTDRLNNNRTYNFLFEKSIDSVFQTVSCICDYSVNFFKKYFDQYTPLSYTQTKLSWDETFYFKIVISKHLTYIDYFRRYILKNTNNIYNVIGKEQKDLNKKINSILISYLRKYLNLYFETFKSLAKIGKMPDSLIKACLKFIELNEKLDEIEKSSEPWKIKLEKETDYNIVYTQWRKKCM